MNISFAAVIPAAGNSERMGTDKSLLPIGHGLTFAAHLVSCFGLYGCNPVVLVVNEKAVTTDFGQGNLFTIVNHHVNLGRTYSIRLGLSLVPTGTACFIHNIDNPFLEPVLLDRLVELVQPGSYVVPVHDGRGGHPIMLGTQVADHIRGENHEADFRETLKLFNRVELPWPDEGILWNINTPEDYKRFIQGIRG